MDSDTASPELDLMALNEKISLLHGTLRVVCFSWNMLGYEFWS